MLYSGIDLHLNNSVVTVTDEADRVVAGKRLPNDLTGIINFLLPWRDELKAVVVESTYNWCWLVDGLQEAGFVVKLANTVAINQYEGLKHKGDEADARHLACQFDWASCYRHTGRYATWPGNACSWYTAVPATSSPSIILRRGNEA